MKKHIPLLLLALFATAISFAQQNLTPILEQVKFSDQITPLSAQSKTTSSENYQPHLSQFFKKMEETKTLSSSIQTKQAQVTGSSDTIWVGKPKSSSDTLIITGNYPTHTGPIIVLLNGVLIIHKANFTNVGDLIAGFGTPKIFIDSSTVSFPQSYFYERSIILVGGSQMFASNTTFDYSGLSHNLVMTDSAKFGMSKITMNGWTTAGLSSKSQVGINGINQAGEYILYDHCNFFVKNATDVLLWHQIPDTAVINWSFGKKDTAYNYQFNKAQAGIKGIEYNVYSDSCYNVMWALMPSAGSNVTINNSKIRAIGAWFDHPNDSTIASGLVDNSTYSSFTAPLSDRTLQLNNCTLQTWSLYVFKKSKLNVTGCIAGEIGAEASSRIYGQSIVVDGSGGYFWSADTSVVFANNVTVTSYVRSEKSGFFILSYSTVSGGIVSAIGKSIMIVVQSSVPSDPSALEGGVAWFDNINQPAPIYAESNATINGSAWIDRGPTSVLMDFGSWQLFYQKNGDLTWTPITGVITSEVRNGLLANWDTHGIVSGTYNLKLTLTDSWGNPVDAIKQVTVLSTILGVDKISGVDNINVYPVPSNGNLFISLNSSVNENMLFTLYNALGNKVMQKNMDVTSGSNTFNYSENTIAPGLYMLEVKSKNGTAQRKILID